LSIIRREESKGGERSGPHGIEVEIRALEHDNIEFLKDGEAILIRWTGPGESTGGGRPGRPPLFKSPLFDPRLLFRRADQFDIVIRGEKHPGRL
jgi:hypothetical protein